MNRTIRNYWIVGLASLLLTGCASTLSTDPGAGISRANGRIHARADFIGEQADQIIDAPPTALVSTVKPQAESIKSQSGKITADVTEADKHVATLENTILQLRIEYTQLESKWYVRVGKWIERALWMLAIAYIGAGLLAIFLPMKWPVWGLTISKNIVRAVPFMNWASWIRDVFARKAGK